jgi:hypothetical protein
MKQLLQQHNLRCTTAATALPTVTALLLGWALQEEESTAIRLAMRDAMQCTEAGQQGKVRWHPRACKAAGGRMDSTAP